MAGHVACSGACQERDSTGITRRDRLRTRGQLALVGSMQAAGRVVRAVAERGATGTRPESWDDHHRGGGRVQLENRNGEILFKRHLRKNRCSRAAGSRSHRPDQRSSGVVRVEAALAKYIAGDRPDRVAACLMPGRRDVSALDG